MARRRVKQRRRRRDPTPGWTEAHVSRLFWRAGFGATPAERRRWARRTRGATVSFLLDVDGVASLAGREPRPNGRPLDPLNEFGHHVLWWMDRMVRSRRPLQGRMTLIWHDHFATRQVARPLMLRQNQTLREHALGRFPDLLMAVTLDPAMQRFLSLAGSHKAAPNENYARELMELFTLGSGYTERDIREAARALTGFVFVRENGQVTGIRFDPSRHDDGVKTIFGRTGRFGWADVLTLCLEHPRHAPFLVETLWNHFIPTPIPAAVRDQLAATYRNSGMRIAPVVRKILVNPALYADLDRPTMIKPPAVAMAGTLRRMGAPVDRRNYVRLTGSMGQRLFSPPSVAGWDGGEAWMSSNAMRARFIAANELLRGGGPAAVRSGSVPPDLNRAGHIALALEALGNPEITPVTRRVMRRLAGSHLGQPQARSKRKSVRREHAETLQRSLRHLLIAGPDNHVC